MIEEENLLNKNNILNLPILKKINKIKKNRKFIKLFNALKFYLPDEINFKYFKYYLKKNLNANANLAWKIYILLITSVLSNKIPKNEGNFEAILNGIYSFFKDIQKYSLEYERSKITIELSFYLLNKEIRPFLGKWHSKKINENFNILNDEFRKELTELQDKIKDDYLELFSDLAYLYHKKERIKSYTNN